MRIGHGYDCHRFVEHKRLMLAGVAIEHSHGLLAHSDGDAVLHAVCDALLGAAGLGDIGQHFPDTDDRFKDQDSAFFVTEICAQLRDLGWRVGNVDVTVIAEQPKLSPHLPVMRERIAQLLSVTGDCVNLKATTHEKMGALGRSEGIAVHAVALLLSE